MKVTSCLIGFTLLFASLAMSGLKRDTKIFTNFYSLLDEKQKSIKKEIYSALKR